MRPPSCHALQKLVGDIRVSRRGGECRQPVDAGEDTIFHRTRLDVPGQRMMHGTRKPPSNTVPLVARNGVMPPSGQVKTSAPLSVVKMTMVLLASPISSRCWSKSPTHRRIAPFRLLPGHNCPVRFIIGYTSHKIREDMHPCGVVPDKERLAGLLASSMKHWLFRPALRRMSSCRISSGRQILHLWYIRTYRGTVPVVLHRRCVACPSFPSAACPSDRPFRSRSYGPGCADHRCCRSVLRGTEPVRVRHRVEMV